MSRRVVITGTGSISSLGSNSDQLWKNLVSGISGISLLKKIDTESLNIKIGGEILDYDSNNFFEEKDSKKLDLFSQYALIAADQAIQQSQINTNNVGVIIGTGVGGINTLENEHEKYISRGQRGVSPYYVPKMIPNIAGGQIAIKYDFRGINFSISTACSSATDSIGISFKLIQNGMINTIICGGSEAGITPLTISGFSNMKALSKNNDNPEKASRPFDKMRDGFVLSEGSGIIILEEFEHAKKRGAIILGEIIGYGSTNDAYHITQPHSESIGASSAIDKALKDAKIVPEMVSYINAHGTSTYYNDLLETNAIKKSFTNCSKNVSISSTKSMTGHLLGATGAIEAIACTYAINNSLIPPTINLENIDPECDLDYTPNLAKEKNVEIAMSNSFGFGGHNSVLLIKKFS